MIVCVISFSKKGYQLSQRLAEADRAYRERLHKRESVQFRLFSKWNALPKQDTVRYVEELAAWTGMQFAGHHALVFIGACGIAVRCIAPFVRDKLADSPVLVLDEKGQFVIPVLSGHVGRANCLAKEFAEALGVTAVVTTATDVNGKFAVDSFAGEWGFSIQNRHGIEEISSHILGGERVTFAVEDMDAEQCREFLQKRIGAGTKSTGEIKSTGKTENAGETESVCPELVPVSAVDAAGNGIPHIMISMEPTEAVLWLKPRVYILGIGCKKGKDFMALRDFVEQELKKLEIPKEEVWQIVSADRKREEEGLLELADAWHIPFCTYGEEELARLKGDFSGSAFVEQTVGVDNVCERAAWACCGGKGEFVLRKTAKDGMTLAIVRRDWRTV